MRYEDSSHTGSSTNETLIARNDSDGLAAGSRGPATGNVMTGDGTQTGAVGADALAAGAHLVQIAGANGSDAQFSDGHLEVVGRFGTLTIDAQGNYRYLANPGTPENARDEFTYKIADANGDSDSATLTILIGKTHAVGNTVVQASAQQVIPGPDGLVTLPAGVELSDIHVVGRNLVIDMPDGTQMVIVDGAVFVPQLVLGTVEVPSTNLAALLIDSEPQPAAGNPQSSGGNFAVPVAPLDPGVPLGDLIPPTVLDYRPPDFREVGREERRPDHVPTVVIQTPDNPAGVENATSTVFEDALPARNGEPAGSNASSPAESVSGTIRYTSVDTPNAITIDGVLVTGVNQVIQGTYGTLTITSINGPVIGYTYTLTDNTNGDTTRDVFTVVVTDHDGDQDTATLTVSIVDDVPTARADVDSVREDGPLVADGNVVTGVGGADANTTDGVADTPGADGIHVTGIAFGETTGTIGSALASDHGTLVLNSNGSYTYTLNNGDPAVQALGAGETLTETFTYTITDGDGDVRSTTLTITINGSNDAPVLGVAIATVSEEGLAAGIPDSTGLPTDVSNSATAHGQIAVSDADGDALSVVLGLPADLLTSHGIPLVWTVSTDGHVLTASAGETAVVTVTVGNDGQFDVVLSGPVDHPNPGGEDVLPITIPVTLGDGVTSVGSTITVNIEDDSPTIATPAATSSSVTLDESDGASPLSSGAPISATSDGAVIAAGVDYGADGAGVVPVYGLSLLGGASVGSSVASGLSTSLGDHPITLTLTSATLVTGSYSDAGGSHTAFTIAINGNGSITVTQYEALEHPLAGSTAAAFDDAITLDSAALGNLVNATVTYHDADGDSVSASAAIGGVITFRDDGPSIDVTVHAGLVEPVLTTRDQYTDGTPATQDSDSSSANFGGAFDLAFTTGSDGAATPTLAYDLGVTSPVSGLASHGQAINLFVDAAGHVIGTTAASLALATAANTIFEVSVSGTGVVTLTQYAQIDHPTEASPVPGTDAPFADQIASLADHLITLTASSTITDNDGDQASDTATIDIGANLHFADDGPAISAALVTGAHLTIDETDGADNAPGEVDVVGGNLGTVTIALGGLFTVTTDATSADAPTTTAYALTLGTPNGAGLVNSGLLLSTTNAHIYLYQLANGSVVGSTATTAATVAAANTVFAVAIDANGATTLTQYFAVEHGDAPANYDEASSGLATGALSVTVTATDYDHDTDTASVDLGSIIRFEDDGPSIDVTVHAGLVEPVLTTRDQYTDGTPATQDSDSSSANFGGAFDLAFTTGSDGAATPTLAYDLGVTSPVSGLASHGQAINLFVDAAGHVIGTTAASLALATAANTIFEVSVSGTGVVTLTQYAQIDHPTEASPVPGTDAPFADQIASLADHLITLTASSTITDNDGDQASDTATIDIGANLHFADDGPAISAALVTGAHLTIDETDGADNAPGEVDVVGGNLGTVTIALGGLFTVTTDATSADAPTTTAYALTLGTPNGAGLVDSGLLLSTTNAHIYLYQLANGSVVGSTATTAATVAAANTVFAVAIDANGATTLTQYFAVEHGDAPANYDEASSGLATGALSVTVTATDYDHDTDTASVDLGSIIRFEDDGPSIDVTVHAGLVEPVLTTRDQYTDGTPATQDSDSSSANFGGAFDLAFTTGSDGAATPTLAYDLGVTSPVSGLASHGQAINLFVDAAGHVIGTTAASLALATAANTIFEVSVSGTGVVTLTQYAQIDHPTEASPVPGTDAPFADQIASLADHLITLTASSTITDNDGDQASDTATIDIGANLHFADDGPAISAALVTGAHLTIDETDGADNAPGEVDVVGGNLGTVTIALGGLFTVTTDATSADAPTTTAYALTLGTPNGAGLVDSGLLLSTTNAHIYLYQLANGSVVGSTATTAATVAAANTVFAVAIDANGATTLTQYFAVEHGDAPANYDEASSGLATGALSVTVTATDYDHDTDTASVDLGSIIRFEDDGPSIDVTVHAGLVEPVLTTRDQYTDGTPATQDSDSSSANFGGAFDLAFTTGSDGAATPTLAYDLGVTSPVSGLASHGQAINLFVDAAGHVIGTTAASLALATAANTIFEVSVSGTGVVTLTQYAQIDHPTEASPVPGTDAPFADQIASLADHLITLTASSTITDNDGDQASDTATIDIGANLHFADDGPAISAALVTGAHLTIDETDGADNAPGEVDVVGGNLGTVTIALGGLFTVTTDATSADAPTTTAYALTLGTPNGAGLVDSGLLLSTTNAHIYLYQLANGSVVGSTATTAATVAAANTVFAVAIDANGATTLTQYFAVEHGDAPANYDEASSGLATGALSVTVTATDYDHDTDTASVDLGSIIRFEDDGPSIDVTVHAGLVEPVLTTRDQYTDGTPATQDSDSSSANFGGAFDLAFTTGSDGAATPTLAYDLGVTSPVSGLASHGQAINLFVDAAGHVIGTTAASLALATAANTIFEVSVSGTGVVTLTQYAQIDHPTEASPVPGTDAPFADQIASLADHLITLTASSTITDNDGDQASDTATIDIGANLHFADDGPAISAALVTGAHLTIDETDGADNAPGEVDVVGGNLGTVTIALGGLFTVTTDATSADAPTTTAYALTLGTPNGAGLVDSGLLLSTTNAHIYLYQLANGSVVGSTATTAATVAAANTVFAVAIDANGATTLTQYFAVEHGDAPANYDEASSGLATGALSVTVTATDYDHDTDTASVDLGSIIRFEDDGPSIDVTVHAGLVEPVLTTRDQYTDGTPATQDSDSSSANFGGAFDLAFTTGSDGAATPTLAYDLGVTSPVSGLASHGQAINLFVDAAGHVIGTTAASLALATAANTIFEVSVSGTGVVTLTQYAQIDHPTEASPVPGTDAPFADQIASLADHLITLTASSTITDNDGDQASDTATIDIGANLHFADDGPAISAALVTGAHLTIDETDGADNAPGEVDVVGGNLGTVTIALGGLFTVTTDATSADAPTTTAYALTLGTPNGAGLVDSGLLLSTTNAHIYLYQLANGSVVGSTATTAATVAAANTVFAVAIDANGATTLTQYFAVEHGDAPANYDEASSGLATGALSVTVTATDYDHDTDTASVDLGSIIRFEDDGPSIDVTVHAGLVEPVLTTRDQYTDGTPATQDSDSSSANFGGAFDLAFTTGSDGAATPTLAYDLGVTSPVSGLASHGQAINLFVDAAGHVIGTTAASLALATAANTIFEVSVSGTGVVTLTQYAQIDHPTEASPVPGTDAPFADQIASLADHLITLTASSTITDNDGDQASDTATIDIGANLHFADDGPAISAALVTGAHLTIDETDGADNAPGEVDVVGGNLGTVTIALGGLFTVTTDATSADAPTTTAYALTLGTPNGAGLVDSGLLLSTTNAHIYLYQLANGSVVGSTATTAATVAAANTVFAVAIDANGATTLTQYFAVEHGDAPANYDEASSGLATGALSVTVTATDYDHDTDTASVDLGSIIRFEDDGPSIDVTVHAGLVEPVLTTRDQYTDGTPATQDSDSSSANFGGAFDLAFTTGSDGAATPTLAYDLGVTSPVSGLASHGQAINLFVDAAGHVIGTTAASLALATAANTIFEVSVSGTGVVTLTQYAQIDHPTEASPVPGTDAPFADQIASLADHLITLTASSTITDNDGDQASDTATIDIGANLHFADDGPAISAALVTGAHLTIDETDGADNAPGEVDVVGGNLGTVTIALGGLFTVTTDATSADAPTTTAYALTLGTPNGAGLVDSGLLLSTTNAHIYLYQLANGSVVGSTATTAATVAAANTVFAVAIDANGATTLTQYFAVEHGDAPANYDEASSGLATGALSVTVTATDYDHDTDTASVDLGSIIRFEDDGPTTFTPQAAVVVNNNSAPFTGALDFGDVNGLNNNYGSDGGTVRFPSSLAGPSGLTSNSTPIVYSISADGLVLTATAGANTIFIATLNPATSTYTIDMNGTIDSFTHVNFQQGGYDLVGGNTAWVGFVPSGEENVPINNSSPDLLVTPSAGSTVNLSSIVGGIGGNTLEGSESFRLDFVRDLLGTPSSGGAGYSGANINHTYDGHYNTNGASVYFQASGGSTLRFTASQDADGNNSIGDGVPEQITGIAISYNGVNSALLTPTATLQTVSLVVNNVTHTFTYQLAADGLSVNVGGISGTSGAQAVGTTVAVFTADGYNSLNVAFVSGDTVRFGDFGASIPNTDPVHFNLPVEIVDNDGDIVAGSPIAVTANTPPVVPPILLDTNHDGAISYLGLDAGVHYDYNGDGHAEATAWVGGGDSILVRDADGNGTVSDASEFVFGASGVTDMEALHAQYGDQLDASDADFVQFMVWNDANGNGIADAGEMQSLTDAAITSIGLVSDGIQASAAGGDVHINGSSGFTYTNDNGETATGLAADVAFRTGRDGDLAQRMTAAASSTAGVVSAAVAAMGLATEQAAAHVVPQSSGQHGWDLAAAGLAVQQAERSGIGEAGGYGNHAVEIGSQAVAGHVAAQASGHVPTAAAAPSHAAAEAHHEAAAAPAALLSATDAPAAQATTALVAPSIVMPSADALHALAARVDGHDSQANHQASVGNVVASALQGGSGGHDLDALLAHLPSAAAGENSALQALASQQSAAVPTWDTGHFAHLAIALNFNTVLDGSGGHHDALPAAVNG